MSLRRVESDLWAVSGSATQTLATQQIKTLLEENAAAMDVDSGHMTWRGLAQSIPPPMAQLVASQMAMAIAHERFGAPKITYDDFEQRPS